MDTVAWGTALAAPTGDDLAATLVALARVAQDLADQAGLLTVMVTEVTHDPSPAVQAATTRARDDLGTAAAVLGAVAREVRP